MVENKLKQAEMDAIPINWKINSLGKVMDVFRGGSPRPIQEYITTSKNGVNWIKIGDVGAGAKYIDRTDEKIIPEGVLYSRTVNVGGSFAFKLHEFRPALYPSYKWLHP